MIRALSISSLALAAVLVIPACGGGGGGNLDPDTVTNLPPGDATGTAATGVYALDSITTACTGACTTTVDGFEYDACDIGTHQESTADLTQVDGVLTIDVPDSDYVSQLAGGIDADGSYDVGGLRTQQGGQITITARSTGTLVGGHMMGSAQLLVEGMGLSCRIGIDVDGQREASAR